MTGHISLHNVPLDANITYDVNYINRTTSEEIGFRLYDYDIEACNENQGLNQNELDEIDMLVLCYDSSSDISKNFIRDTYSERLKSLWPNVPTMLASCSFDHVYDNLSANQSDKIMPTLDEELLSAIKPAKLVHCSSFKNFNVENVFVESFKIATSSVKNALNKNISTRLTETTLSKKHDQRLQVSNKKNQVTLINKTRHSFEDELGRVEDILMIKHFNISGKSFRTIVTLFGLACFVFYCITYKYCMENSMGFKCDQDILGSGLTASNQEQQKSTLISVLKRLLGN
jgi:hypothetical protein